MGVEHVTVRFYGSLRELASDADRAGEAHVPTALPRSVKDVIETCGVPHTELDLVLVNGTSVDLGALVRGGDRVSAYPPFHDLDIDAVSHVRPPPLPPRFVLDVHLGRLSERLRLLGFDTDYASDRDDTELARISVEDRRWLLTRDRGLLMRAVVTHGYLVRAHHPTEQTVEVVRRFDLADEIRPFSRCIPCGGPLGSVAKEEVVDEIPPRTRRDHEEFVRCERCGRVFWEGSHHDALNGFVEEVRLRTSDPATPPGPAPTRSRRTDGQMG